MIDLGLTGQTLKDQNGDTIGTITEYSLEEERGEIIMRITLNERGKNYIKTARWSIKKLEEKEKLILEKEFGNLKLYSKEGVNMKDIANLTLYLFDTFLKVRNINSLEELRKFYEINDSGDVINV